MSYVKSGAEALDGLYVREYPQFDNKKHWCFSLIAPLNPP